MKKIHLLWATARPRMFKDTVAYWLNKATYPDRIVIKVAVDTKEQKKELDGYNILVTNPPWKGVAYVAHKLTTSYHDSSRGDIIVFGSDDFYPPQAWDEFLYKEVDEYCCLLVNDGIVVESADAVTLPILGNMAFLRLNKIIYNRAYKHMYSDSELYYNCRSLGIIKNLRSSGPVFEHRHYANGKREKDDLDLCNQACYYDDQKTFKRRLKLPLKYRLR